MAISSKHWLNQNSRKGIDATDLLVQKTRSTMAMCFATTANHCTRSSMPRYKLVRTLLPSILERQGLWCVYTIYRDKHDYVWIGTAALGVCRYDGKASTG